MTSFGSYTERARRVLLICIASGCGVGNAVIASGQSGTASAIRSDAGSNSTKVIVSDTRSNAVAAAQSIGGSNPAQGSAPVVRLLDVGADGAAAPITFEQAIRIALKQSLSIKQGINQTAQSASAVQLQRLAFLPSLSFSANTAQSYSGQNQSAAVTGSKSAQSLNTGLSANATLFDGFRNIATLRSAQLTQNADTQDLARTRQTVVFTVASNFLALVTQQEQLRVQQENLTAQLALLDQIEKLVKAGTRSTADLYQQQATVAGVRSTLVDAERSVELANVDLIQTLQLNPSNRWEFETPVMSTNTVAAPKIALDSLLSIALATRVDLQAQQTRTDAASQEVRAARGSRLPTLTLSAGYNTTYSSASETALMNQLDQRKNGSIALGISLPLFDRGSTSAATERARLNVDNAQLALANQRQQVALEVRRAYLDYQTAQLQLEAADAQTKAATQAVAASEQRYRVGAATLVDVTQSRASLVQAQSAQIRARYGLQFQKTVIDYYIGRLDSSNVALSAF